MTVAVPSSHHTARELLLESARERMDIIAAHRETGTYGGLRKSRGPRTDDHGEHRVTRAWHPSGGPCVPRGKLGVDGGHLCLDGRAGG